MSTETGRRVIEGPLSVVLRPGSEAEAAYESAVLAPGFGPDPGLDLRYFGGKTLPSLRYTNVYVGAWSDADRASLDAALSAAMRDQGLNNVIVQYFPKTGVTATFAGSKQHEGTVPATVTRDVVEGLVAQLDLGPSVACICLPKGAVLVDTGDVDSKHGLGGYHGSVKLNGSDRYYAVAVYSEGDNGIVAFDEPWKNVCATLYHELEEARTDPDVEDAIRTGESKYLGWYSPRGGEIGDIPIATSPLHEVMREVPLADGSGTVPVQLMWSNKDEAPAAS